MPGDVNGRRYNHGCQRKRSNPCNGRVGAPVSLAVENDRIGLQVGDPEAQVDGVLLALDVTEKVVDEAIRIGAGYQCFHHAVIFRPLKDLRTDTPAGRLYAKLLKSMICMSLSHIPIWIPPGAG